MGSIFTKTILSFCMDICDPPQDFSHFGETRARHVRQRMQELSRNDVVRILLIKNFLCVGQHGRNNSLCAGNH